MFKYHAVSFPVSIITIGNKIRFPITKGEICYKKEIQKSYYINSQLLFQ